MSAQFAYSSARIPPIPAAAVILGSPNGNTSIPDVPAQFDTAADRTVVPFPLIQHLGLQPIQQVNAHGFGGAILSIGVFRIQFELPGVLRQLIDVLGLSDEKYVLIGRDILNQFRITFDGPNQSVEFH
jgi:hypothetical protein